MVQVIELVTCSYGIESDLKKGRSLSLIDRLKIITLSCALKVIIAF